MDQRRFDRMTAEWVAGSGRRSVIAGLLAGAAAVFVQRDSAPARKRGKKRKKKPCLGCPQFACCSCGPAGQPPTKCGLIDAPNFTDAQNACTALCGTGNFQLINQKIAGVANSCNADFTCKVTNCPVPLKS